MMECVDFAVLWPEKHVKQMVSSVKEVLGLVGVGGAVGGVDVTGEFCSCPGHLCF